MGPYFSQYIYAETPGYVAYLSIALWLVLLAVVATSMYSLTKSLNSLLWEMREINATALELMNETSDVEKILEQV
ncbi:hypothetical protein [Thermococcus thermotolerans]|uniref:hypothetical protein n=1 Tax=Thermococcus thermotolerans TaxID=2969672 RepID=UPI002157AF86|nr:hypothetical protein [Thermococcus thermotolerans]